MACGPYWHFFPSLICFLFCSQRPRDRNVDQGWDTGHTCPRLQGTLRQPWVITSLPGGEFYSRRVVIGLGVKEASVKNGEGRDRACVSCVDHYKTFINHELLWSLSGHQEESLDLKFLFVSALFHLLFITKLAKILRKKFTYFPLILFLPSYWELYDSIPSYLIWPDFTKF